MNVVFATCAHQPYITDDDQPLADALAALGHRVEPEPWTDIVTSTIASPQMDVLYFARPFSNHPSGFMIAKCDGSIKFVQENIDYTTYMKLMSSAGKKYKSAGYTTVQSVNTTAQSIQMGVLSDSQY